MMTDFSPVASAGAVPAASPSQILAALALERADFRLDVQLQLPGRGVTALFGPSGCGKTTCLRALAGLERARGRVVVNGEVWQDDAASQWLPTHRRALGYVFQEASLFPHLSVQRNIDYGMRRTPAERRKVSQEQAVSLLGIGHLMDRMPSTLSGGERQRVAIARALAMRPELILFDEVTSALDPETVGEVLTVIRDLVRDGMTCVLVTHEMRFAEEVSDQVYFTEAGRIVEHGPAAQIFGSPRSERTREFLQRALGDGARPRPAPAAPATPATAPLPFNSLRFAL